ncbi:MAG: acyl carrier protein [Candidatus Cryptobacteroides sp.]
MNKEEITRRVFEILSERLNILTCDIEMDSSLEELGANDWDITEIMMDCEYEFGIEIPYAASEGFTSVVTSVENIINYIRKH